MGACEVGHVDVVADAGAVRSGIVIAEQGDGLARLNGPEEQRDQMSLRFVIFAGTSGGVGSRCVEVTQANTANAVDFAEPVKKFFDHHFRFAISVDRGIGQALGNRHHAGHAVNCRSRGEHDVLHAGFHHRREQG